MTSIQPSAYDEIEQYPENDRRVKFLSSRVSNIRRLLDDPVERTAKGKKTKGLKKALAKYESKLANKLHGMRMQKRHDIKVEGALNIDQEYL